MIAAAVKRQEMVEIGPLPFSSPGLSGLLSAPLRPGHPLSSRANASRIAAILARPQGLANLSEIAVVAFRKRLAVVAHLVKHRIIRHRHFLQAPPESTGSGKSNLDRRRRGPRAGASLRCWCAGNST